MLDYVPGERCPIEARLHGTENLLHRACVAGNSLVGLIKFAVNNYNMQPLFSRSTVWKFQDFSITQILREINFRDP